GTGLSLRTNTLVNVTSPALDTVPLKARIPAVGTGFGGQLFVTTMTGQSGQTTVTTWAQELELPQASVTRQLAVMISGQSELVTRLARVTVKLGLPLGSEAVGGSNTQLVPHCTDLLLAQVTSGGVVSIRVTDCAQVLLFPQASRALQVRVATKVLPQRPEVFVTVEITEI